MNIPYASKFYKAEIQEPEVRKKKNDFLF